LSTLKSASWAARSSSSRAIASPPQASPPLFHLGQAIAAFPPPATIKKLQAFLGLFNFYRHFIPAAARIVLPRLEAFEKIPLNSIPMARNNAGNIIFQNNRIIFKIAIIDKLLNNS
jgi:hypothetical protein